MVRPAIVAEKAGIPSVAIAATGFLPLARVVGQQEGIPDIRVAEYPGTFSIESTPQMSERLEQGTFRQILDALTGPVAPARESASTGGNEAGLITGTFREINEYFREWQWTDGLPVMPPTVEEVEAFLQYTDRDPHEEIAILQPGNLRATPFIIAANAIMAGCRAEHMPILIAAVEAIADPDYDLDQLGTTGAINPYLLINGPIVKELGIEFGTALTSRGPNPAIGRALGLIIRNVANFKPALQYMGTFGYITPFVLAEDEAGSPWNPYHVDRGFDRNASTVTAGGTQNWGFQSYPSGTDTEGHLKAICQDIVKRIVLWGPIMHKDSQMMTVLLTPPVAQSLARAGYSKHEVERYFFENSRVSIRDIELILKHGYCCGEGETIRSMIEKESGIPPEWGGLGPDDTVPGLGYPGVLKIAVCGDRTRNKTMALCSSYTKPVTREIRLPAKWNERRKKT